MKNNRSLILISAFFVLTLVIEWFVYSIYVHHRAVNVSGLQRRWSTSYLAEIESGNDGEQAKGVLLEQNERLLTGDLQVPYGSRKPLLLAQEELKIAFDANTDLSDRKNAIIAHREYLNQTCGKLSETTLFRLIQAALLIPFAFVLLLWYVLMSEASHGQN